MLVKFLLITDSMRNMLMLKAKKWVDLDNESQDQVLQYQVEFQGNMFKLGSLKVVMNEKRM